MSTTKSLQLAITANDSVQILSRTGDPQTNIQREPTLLLMEGQHLAWKLWDFPAVRERELRALVRSRVEAESLLPIEELVCGVQTLPTDDPAMRRVSVCLARRTILDHCRQVIEENGGRLTAVLPTIALLARSLPRRPGWHAVVWLHRDSYDLAMVRDGLVWSAATGLFDEPNAVVKQLQRDAGRLWSGLQPMVGATGTHAWTIVVAPADLQPSILSQFESLGLTGQVLPSNPVVENWSILLSENVPGTARTATWPWLTELPTPSANSLRESRTAWWIRSAAAALLLGSLWGGSLWWRRESARQAIETWKSRALQQEAFNEQLSRRTASIEPIRHWLGQRCLWTDELARLGRARLDAPACEIGTLYGHLGTERSTMNLRVQGTAAEPESVITFQQHLLQASPEARVIPYGVRPIDRQEAAVWQFEFELVRNFGESAGPAQPFNLGNDR